MLMHSFRQAQYHGEVAFARHVERLVLPKAGAVVQKLCCNNVVIVSSVMVRHALPASAFCKIGTYKYLYPGQMIKSIYSFF